VNKTSSSSLHYHSSVQPTISQTFVYAILGCVAAIGEVLIVVLH
jgi:hypothetical protein